MIQAEHNPEDFRVLVVVQEDLLHLPATAQYCDEMKAEYGWNNLTVVYDPIGRTVPFMATEDPDYPNGAIYILINEDGIMEKVRMHDFELTKWIEDLTTLP